jgi:hypothetical protein
MKFFLLFISVFIINKAEGQYLSQYDSMTVACWKIVNLDSSFNEISNGDSAKYFYYEYRDSLGNYIPTYNKKGFLPKGFTKIIYTKASFKRMKKSNVTDEHLLNGTLDFYDEKNQLYMKYVLEIGFIRKIYKYNFRLFGKYRATKNFNLAVAWEIPKEDYYRIGGAGGFKISLGRSLYYEKLRVGFLSNINLCLAFLNSDRFNSYLRDKANIPDNYRDTADYPGMGSWGWQLGVSYSLPLPGAFCFELNVLGGKTYSIPNSHGVSSNFYDEYNDQFKTYRAIPHFGNFDVQLMAKIMKKFKKLREVGVTCAYTFRNGSIDVEEQDVTHITSTVFNKVYTEKINWSYLQVGIAYKLYLFRKLKIPLNKKYCL